tara:strand:+ start:238 stop:441 length:204 start_codon:yes stop_codon:yes gene_type:complete
MIGHCTADQILSTKTMGHCAALAGDHAEVPLDLSSTMSCNANGFRCFDWVKLNDVASAELRERIKIR